MKIIIYCLLIGNFIFAEENLNFNDYFTDETMRIDYYHSGDAQDEFFTIDQISVYGTWAGSINNLIDHFNNGRYYIKIYDHESSGLIFSRGFDSYFGEYKTSDDALAGIMRTYHESAVIPAPKDSVKFVIEKRNRDNKQEECFSVIIDPHDVSVLREPVKDELVTVYKSLISGEPHKKVDIVLLGEGYTKAEVSEFEQDLEKFSESFFSYEPYISLKNKFNIYGVLKPSEESGVDEPRAGIYRNTVLNATFNSLGSARYLLTEDNKTVRDLAAHVPYDAIFIMVNHERYGGGGIYNLFCTFTSDNQFFDFLLIHEFGHSFAGLADEYYTSDVAYNDFYPKGIEPVEPNITALLDPEILKWQHHVKVGTDIPTPWGKNEYDKAENEWQVWRREMNKKISELKRKNAPQKEIEKARKEYAYRDSLRSVEVNKYLNNSELKGIVGAFEGAGYSSRGLYRPMLNCIMFSRHMEYCLVCKQAIEKVVAHYTE